MTNPERYCLACEKSGHLTTECHSTHGLNTPAARELFRLTQAAAPVRVSPDQWRSLIEVAERAGEARGRMEARLNKYSVTPGGVAIYDHLDQADVLIRIDGDFESDADREQYANALCVRLQSAQALGAPIAPEHDEALAKMASDAEAQFTADLRDAGRYRKLRQGGQYIVRCAKATFHCGGHTMQPGSRGYPEAFDAAVDAMPTPASHP